MSQPFHAFQCEGKQHSCSFKARFLVESANGTSSYTLERGFSDPFDAVSFYSDLAAVGAKKKRLTMIDNGKRTVLARTK